MTINLPPRRELPADVKERMRPALTEARPRRNHTPLAVAASVTLLIAGGVAVIQSATHDVDPGHDRVVTPSGRDVDRCRTALNDQSWSSSEMVVFGPRKVLVGTDGRFCELTRSKAIVAPQGFEPTVLEAGRITYRSGNVIAGVPPLGARTAKARESDGDRRTAANSVVTPDFFIVHSQAQILSDQLVFDDRTYPIPRFTSWSAEGTTDSFESGDKDPWTPVNLLDRCIDNSSSNNVMSAEELQGWEPLQASGLEGHHGVLIAHRAHREWATCAFTETRLNSLSPIRTTADDPDASLIIATHQSETEFTVIGRTHRSAKTVEVSDRGLPLGTAEVADGLFITTRPVSGTQMITPVPLYLVARDSDKEIVYEGSIS